MLPIKVAHCWHHDNNTPSGSKGLASTIVTMRCSRCFNLDVKPLKGAGHLELEDIYLGREEKEKPH